MQIFILIRAESFSNKLTFYLLFYMTTINALFSCFPNISPFIVAKSNGDRKILSPFLQLWLKTTQLRIHQTLELNQKHRVPAQHLPGMTNLINFLTDFPYGCHFKQHSTTWSDNYITVFTVHQELPQLETWSNILFVIKETHVRCFHLP